MIWVLLAAGLFYTIRASYYWVGSLNDDAQYILLAQSLLTGTYRKLQTIDLQFAATYPPGFPILLSPFVWLLEPHWSWLKAVPIALTLGSGVLFWKLIQELLPARARYFALCFFLFNSFILLQSAYVTSSAAFLFICLACYLYFYRVLKNADRSDAWMLGLFIAGAIWVRSSGVILIPVFLSSLFLARKYQAIGRAGSVAILFSTLLGGINFLMTSSASGYASNWVASLLALRDPARLWDHFNRVLNMFFVAGFLGVQLPYSSVGFFLNAVFSIFVLSISMLAFYRFEKRQARQRYLLLSFAIGVVSFFLLHVAWRTIEIHYAVPMIPLLTGIVFTGAHVLYKRVQFNRLLWGAIVGIVGLWVIGRGIDTVFVCRQRANTPEHRAPFETYRWMASHLSAAARIQTVSDSALFLYTRRPSDSVLICTSADEYRYLLLSRGITHQLSRSAIVQTPGMDFGRMWKLNQHWAATSPQAFQPVYQNEGERTKVYEVLASTSYVKAFELYLRALNQWERGDFSNGNVDLEHALQEYPEFVSALIAYGAACLTNNQNLVKARARLQRAVQANPQHALAWLNLARVQRRLRNEAGAQRAFETAQQVSTLSPEWDDLKNQLQSF